MFKKWKIGLMVAAMLLSVALMNATAVFGATYTVTVDRMNQIEVSKLYTGVTHVSADSSIDALAGDPAAVSRAETLLQNSVTYQNQHIMGFGADNPEPSPGVYDWTTLDSRIAMIEAMGGTPVITLCCAPDWMKDPNWTSGTDWSKLEWDPLPAHYQDFADLSAAVADRYPEVTYFQVWNEMKGFWNKDMDGGKGNWDYVNYTDLYNKVYDAVKNVRPDAKIGGPYLVINGTGSAAESWGGSYTGQRDTFAPIGTKDTTVLDYWFQNKHGADFVTVDKKVADKDDPNYANYTRDQAMSLTHWFGDVVTQLKSMANTYDNKPDFPVWFAESYGRYIDPKNHDFDTAMYASMTYHMLTSAASVNLIWDPMTGASGGDRYDHSIFTDVTQSTGGQPSLNYYVQKMFKDAFSRGTALYATTSSSPDIEVAASATRTLLINKTPNRVTVDVDGGVITINGYEVRLMDTSNNTIMTTRKSLMAESFNSESVGNPPSSWTVTQPSGTSVEVSAVPSSSDKSVEIADSVTASHAEMSKTFTAQSDTTNVEFSFMQPTVGGWPVFSVLSGSTRAVQLNVRDDGNLVYKDNAGAYQIIQPVSANTWYAMRLILDPVTNTYDIWVNDDLKVSGATFKNTVTSLDSVLFGSDDAGQGTVYIDLVRVTSPE
jgi:hypothetical protein